MSATTTHTHQVTVTLSPFAMSHIREEIESGVYENERHYIESLVESATLFEPIQPDQLTHWMKTEGACRLQALHDDPSRGLTIDEAFAGLEDDEK